jgi:16S rRNA (cytidine1402-2'-O)-methyltransferase
MIFYESPHRLVKTLKQLGEKLGHNREAAVCREISKIHEETRRGGLEELEKHYNSHPPKGEIVLIVSGTK